MKPDTKDLIKQFIKFGLVGVVNTFTSYAIVNSCYYLLHLHLQLSNAIAFVLSVLVSFTLNSRFVFKKRPQTKRELFGSLLKTYLSYASTGLILTAILIELECNKLGIPLYIASLMNLVITVPVNFLLNKFWAFGKRKELSRAELKKRAKRHTFAICAYQESEYLEDCIKSLLNQTVPTNYLIATSTPNHRIKSLAQKYKIPYCVRKGKSDIQDDWNFAYDQAKTELVTIAHQDDLYAPDYAKSILENYDPKILMYNTDYTPYKHGADAPDKNSKIKRLLKVFTRSKFFARFKFFKVMSLAFGNTINCPSVTYNKRLLGAPLFTSDLKFGLDWDTFLKIARQKGISLYIPRRLVKYRIHAGATTKKFIVDNKRQEEDRAMFNKIWPNWVTNLIMKLYVKSYDTYD